METVLIIEDDSTMMRGLKDNFAYADYNVVTAADGEAGLNAALGTKADGIVIIHPNWRGQPPTILKGWADFD
jgi:DNA-binding response OmpR family regulator